MQFSKPLYRKKRQKCYERHSLFPNQILIPILFTFTQEARNAEFSFCCVSISSECGCLELC